MRILIPFLLLLSQPCLAQAERPVVDMLLVLAIDVSGSIEEEASVQLQDGTSITMNEYELQKQGIASALRDGDVKDVIEQCNYSGIGITYVEWSGASFEEPRVSQVVPWMHIRNGENLESFAQSILDAPRSSNGSTDIVAALKESLAIMNTAPFEADRRVIDLSTDGKQNVFDRARFIIDPNEEDLHFEVMRMRDKIVKQDITLNALVIMNEEFDSKDELALDSYHSKSTYGGPGSFLKAVVSVEDIKDTYKERFLRELNNCMM